MKFTPVLRAVTCSWPHPDKRRPEPGIAQQTTDPRTDRGTATRDAPILWTPAQQSKATRRAALLLRDGGALLGYARVSTGEQNAELQQDALTAGG